MALTKITRKVSKLTHADVGALASNAKAVDSSLLEGSNKASVIASARANLVHESRTVNGLALTANITLNSSHTGSLPAGGKAVDSALLEGSNKASVIATAKAGLVPETRTVNGLALTGNITLNHTHVGAAPSSHTHDYIPNNQKGVRNGVATLDTNGKLPQSQIPAIAINETFTAANEAAMLALVAQVGDICRRTDDKKTYILTAVPASTRINWLDLFTPDSAVTSVNGEIGNVTLDAAKVGALAATATAVNSAKLENSTKAQVIASARANLVPDNRTINGLPLTANISLNSGHVGALASGATAVNSAKLESSTKAQIIADAKAGLVPTSRTINGLTLAGNISLNHDHVGALAKSATAVNSAKLENATKAQIIADAKAGLTPTGTAYTKAEADARFLKLVDFSGQLKRKDIIPTSAINKVAIAPLASVFFVTVGGVMQVADAYTIAGGEITFSETLDPNDAITIIGF